MFLDESNQKEENDEDDIENDLDALQECCYEVNFPFNARHCFCCPERRIVRDIHTSLFYIYQPVHFVQLYSVFFLIHEDSFPSP